jgi:hypothetical protein
MPRSRIRRKIFEKLAQVNPPGAIPSKAQSQTQSVSGSPPPFSAIQSFPTLILAFNQRNANVIEQLSNLLNTVLFYTSNGQVHMQWMRTVAFNFGVTNIISTDLQHVMNFCKQVFIQLFNSGNEYKAALTPQQIAEKADVLKNNTALTSMSSVNPIGQLATKIRGDVKTSIINLLSQIK